MVLVRRISMVDRTLPAANFRSKCWNQSVSTSSTKLLMLGSEIATLRNAILLSRHRHGLREDARHVEDNFRDAGTFCRRKSCRACDILCVVGRK